MIYKKGKLPVKYVVSIGAVILDGKGRVLIVFQNQNKYWEMPKGKVEPGEEKNEITTLNRELFEETGLKPEDYKMINGFKFNQRYQFKVKDSLIRKTNVYYLVKTNKSEVILSDEHKEHKWVSLTAVNRYFKHKSQRILIYKLREFLDINKI